MQKSFSFSCEDHWGEVSIQKKYKGIQDYMRKCYNSNRVIKAHLVQKHHNRQIAYFIPEKEKMVAVFA